MRRHYASSATSSSLATGVNGSATALTVNAVTGYPLLFPWVAIIDSGTALEEVVLVTAGGGTSLTVVRGYDSTAGLDHSVGATFHHGASAIEFDEANLHHNSDSGVHGVAGEVVGTTDTQPLTNKDLTTGNTFPASLATDAEVAVVAGTVTALTAATTASLALKADAAATAASLALKADAAATTAALALKAVATDVTTSLALKADDTSFQAGSANVSFTTESGKTQAVVFPTPFGVAPKVFVNIHATGGTTARWVSRAGNITTAGFDIYVAAPDTTPQTWVAVPVQWFAVSL